MESLAELGTLILRYVGDTSGVAAIPGIYPTVAHQPTVPLLHVYQPVFALVAQGAKRAMLGGKVFSYGTGQYLVVTADLPVVSNVIQASAEAPFIAVGLTLKPATIATLLLEMAANDRAAVESPALAVSNATPDLIEPVIRLLRLRDRPDDVPILAPMIEREILWRLLAGEQGAMVRQIGLADSRLSQINHAIRWIRLHYAEAIRIEELARLTAMSVSSFHRHFRAITTMSPIQYQKQIRLQEARARLLADHGDVAAVGFGVGYDSPSQFSREYARLFGAPPGRDAARLRSVAPLAHPAI